MKIIKSFVSVLIIYLAIVISKSNGARLWIEPSQGGLIKNCPYTFLLKMDTQNISTKSVDSKLFLSGLYIQSVSGIAMDNIDIYTGQSTSGTTIGRQYDYINTYQNYVSNMINGYDITLAQIVMIATGTHSTGDISFYFINPLVNYDDSNVSSGINSNINNAYTKYVDTITQVSGGSYTLIDYSGCVLIPYVVSGNYFQNIILESGYQNYMSGKYIRTGEIFRFYTGRDVRTNSGIYLTITGNFPLTINTGVLSGLPIKLVEGSGLYNRFLITGNFNPFVLYFNYFSFTGNQYKYGIQTGLFYIDSFWIDKIGPDLTGSVSYNQGIYPVLILSGYNTGYAARTTKDDEFKIIGFSGTNPVTSSYLTSSNNTFNIRHSMVFGDVWTGYVIIMDRAGNTGSYLVNIEQTLEYIVKAHPQGRIVTTRTPNPNLATSGDVVIYDSGRNLVYRDIAVTNNFGTGIFRCPLRLSGTYDITFQGLSHLKTLGSGMYVNYETHKFIDFTSGALTRRNGLINNDIINYHISYENISGNPLANIGLQELFNGLNVWSGFNLMNISPTTSLPNIQGQMIHSGVSRSGISLGVNPSSYSGSAYFVTQVRNNKITGFNTYTNQIQIYSGLENITNSGIINITSGIDIIGVEIAGETVRDGEINGVDSSVITDYILTNGATNSNTAYGYVLQDLNANGQVDAADITVHGYNLYRRGITFP